MGPKKLPGKAPTATASNKEKFLKRGEYFKSAVDMVLKDTVSYSNVVDVKVATVFGDSPIVLVESGVIIDDCIQQLISSEFGSRTDERVTAFFCCCLEGNSWTAINTCWSGRKPRTNSFIHVDITENKHYQTYLMEGLLNLTNVPPHADTSKLVQALKNVQTLLGNEHLRRFYGEYRKAMFRHGYVSTLIRPRPVLTLPHPGNESTLTRKAINSNKEARADHDKAVKQYERNQTALEKQLRMQHTLKSLHGLIAFVYWPWKDSVDLVDRPHLRKILQVLDREFEKTLATAVGKLAAQLKPKLIRTEDHKEFLAKCMHCAEDNFLRTCTEDEIRQIKSSDRVLMFSILKGEENVEERVSPPCSFCQSHFRQDIMKMFACNSYATYHVGDVGERSKAPEVLVRPEAPPDVLYRLSRNPKTGFNIVEKPQLKKLRYKKS